MLVIFFLFCVLWKCDASQCAMKDVFIQSCTHTQILRDLNTIKDQMISTVYFLH